MFILLEILLVAVVAVLVARLAAEPWRGRVLNVTALGQDVASAIDKAYQGVSIIHFDEAHYRTDIGQKAITHH